MFKVTRQRPLERDKRGLGYFMEEMGVRCAWKKGICVSMAAAGLFLLGADIEPDAQL